MKYRGGSIMYLITCVPRFVALLLSSKHIFELTYKLLFFVFFYIYIDGFPEQKMSGFYNLHGLLVHKYKFLKKIFLFIIIMFYSGSFLLLYT